MTPGRLRGDRRGLTLIELVLTLSILALAGALVSGALVTGLRAWESGRRSGREELVASIVLERIAAQVRAAVEAPALRGEAAAVAFDAGEHHLRLVTTAADAGAPRHVFYGLLEEGGPARLVYREYPWPDKDFFGDGPPQRVEEVAEISGFSVTVTRRPAAGESGAPETVGTPTTAEWSPLDQELPASVGVEIAVSAVGRSEPHTYRIDVPIPTRRVP